MWLGNISFLAHESDILQSKSLFKTVLYLPPQRDTHLDQQFTRELHVQAVHVTQASDSPAVHYPRGNVLA
jgi:hypothetical protein